MNPFGPDQLTFMPSATPERGTFQSLVENGPEQTPETSTPDSEGTLFDSGLYDTEDATLFVPEAEVHF